ncbi:MAG: glutamate N-acetyltransferase / amino-acid N-acetyltransferase [Desulfuromonadales bacterium]|jgi:glutamate N-acetyltransferase/amino-acid N-acetyltransferase|nr:glutamate N-acetyltransferase / amino-acid N-acetyltransferase [Desulfuromonadales bacterium]
MTTVKGFSFAARAAGIRKSGRLDLGLIFSRQPARSAGVFTTNKVQAAPVLLTAPRVADGLCQAVLVNSGNANACTGEAGLQDALSCGRMVADRLGIDERLVAVSSTGVIGHPLPMPLLEKAIPELPGALSEDAVADVATAMMTTDSFSKISSRQSSGDRPYTLLGVAKGAGMIHPNMATMLAFVVTDACVDRAFLRQALHQAVENSFNIITVDRDTSTNDMVLIMANGEAQSPEIVADTSAGREFAVLLREVLLDLAKMIVRDGEGATKLVHVKVDGAVDSSDARRVAYSVATSNLVKTAFFGEDANWGRIIAAVGYSGAQVDPDNITICFGDVPVVQGGLGTGPEREEEATAVLKQAEFAVHIDLGLGDGRAEYYTSDLTYDYVKINADYRT